MVVLEEIRLLGGAVRLCVDGQQVQVPGRPGPRAIAELVGASPVSAERMREVLDAASKDASQKTLSRLRTTYGLPIVHRDNTYRMNTDGIRVDALELLSTAAIPDGQATHAQVDAALGLWEDGPSAVLEGTALWARLHEARDRLARRRTRLVRRRLLIVEDQVGDRLLQVLGEHECTLVRDLAGFWELRASRGFDGFDAALVDLHLNSGYQDRDGELVVDAINRGSALPVVVMTYRIPGNLDVTEFQRKHNLFAVVTKADDGPGGDFTRIAEVIRDLFKADRNILLLDRLEDRLPGLRRRAGQLLTLRDEPGRVDLMNLKHAKLYDCARQGDLAALRAAVDAFEVEFGLQLRRDG
ncbi:MULTISPECIES: hypothetical protein [Actinosynnema]|uniref:hypothetical protein n=1 Tax=Actinosynnema TaxID=40566 RepID=UPI0020A4CEE6|nr:hypothetical protein [Actinosynnema pretiosum]MCP2094427.1 hypothetical protein [Actinosynnema pretiosum]